MTVSSPSPRILAALGARHRARSPWTLAPALAAVVALSGALLPTAAHGSTQGQPGVVVEDAGVVAVDATEIGTMRPAMVQDIALQATKVMVEANLNPMAARISLVETDPVEVVRGVRVSLATDDVTLRDPSGDPRGPLLARCTACSDAELSGLAIEAMWTAVEQYEDRVRQAREAASAPDSEPAPEPEPVSEPEVSVKKLTVVGWAGISMLLVGAGAVAGGAVLAIPEPTAESPVVLRPTGFVLLGGGSAALLSGAMLLTIDRRRARRSTLSVTPSYTAGFRGMVVRGRF